MTKDEALKLALKALKNAYWPTEADLIPAHNIKECAEAITAIKEALAQPEPWEKFCDSNCVWTDHHPDCKLAQPEPVAWKYDVTYNQDGTVSVALPDGDELRIVLPNQQEPYCWTWDEFVSGGKWRAEYGWKKPTKKVVNLQPLYTSPPQRTWVGLSDEEIKPLCDANHIIFGAYTIDFVQAIEAALKAKNT